MPTGTTTLTNASYTLPSGGGSGTLSTFEFADFRGNTSGSIVLNATGWSHGAYLFGGAGNDTINAGSGAQLIGGYLGTDSLNGGADYDTLSVYSTTSAGGFTLNATQLTGSWGTDTFSAMEAVNYNGGTAGDIFYAALAPFPVALSGNGGNDDLTGGAFGDHLFGNDGTDTLTGNAGDDTIDGGTGTDTCSGGTGTNTLSNCP